MLKKLVMGLVALVFLASVVVSLQPSEYTVERSVVIAATPAQVFPHVNDFELFHIWSPWSDLEANMTVTYGDATVGEGAVYEWSGDDNVGMGRMTITKSVPKTLVVQDLAFIEPFPSTATTEMRLAAVGDKTNVTWLRQGNNDFMRKAFGLFVDMDQMIGADYEKGLQRLSAVVDADVKAEAEKAGAPPTGDADENAPAEESADEAGE